MTKREANNLPDGMYIVRCKGINGTYPSIAIKEKRMWFYNGFSMFGLPEWVVGIDQTPIEVFPKFEHLV